MVVSEYLPSHGVGPAGDSTRPDGTGYGLSIGRSIVGAHGWDISIVDTDDGGVRFEITGVDFVPDT